RAPLCRRRARALRCGADGAAPSRSDPSEENLMAQPHLTQRPEWQALQAHYEHVRPLHLRQLFADDAKRGERLTLEAVGLYFDYSKHRVTDETIGLLLALADACGLRQRIDAMFRGEK